MSAVHARADAFVADVPDVLTSAGPRCAGAALTERLVQRRADLTAWSRAADHGPQTVTRGEVTAAWISLVDDAVIARRAGACACPRHLAEEISMRTWVVLERMLMAAAESVCATPTRTATAVALRFVEAALVVLEELGDHAATPGSRAQAPRA